jgi:hypothetical protein
VPWLVLVLRLTHIVSGVFWAGATFAFAGFIEPTASALGPQSGPFVQHLAGRSGFTQVMAAAGILTILAGVWLFWLDSGGFQPEWMGSGMGVALSIGAVAGLAAAVVGLGIQARNAARLGGLAKAAQQQTGGPSPEQLGALMALQHKLRLGGRITAALLGVTVICMATARYLAF